MNIFSKYPCAIWIINHPTPSHGFLMLMDQYLPSVFTTHTEKKILISILFVALTCSLFQKCALKFKNDCLVFQLLLVWWNFLVMSNCLFLLSAYNQKWCPRMKNRYKDAILTLKTTWGAPSELTWGTYIDSFSSARCSLNLYPSNFELWTEVEKIRSGRNQY